MRRFSLALALAVATPAFAPVVAHAQVSDSERAAARQLFSEGDKLQNDGRFEDALDKFQRAQRVFSAPTNLLRIAQCQTALGKLVEAAETYRTLIRTPLPAGSPAAFQSAVEQAKGELAQVEPRVPTVKIDVTPANVPNLQVQLNGQPLNTALIGEPLPLDPGTHKVLVFAPGYASSEQSITLKEREKKALAFTLRQTGGVAFGAGGAPPGRGDDPGKPPGSVGNTGNPDGTLAPAPPPPPDRWQPARKLATSSVLLGARLGASIPTGDLFKDASGATQPMSDYAGAGGALAIEGGLRFARSFYFGLFLELASLGKGAKEFNAGAGTSTTTTQTSGAFGGVLGYLSNPHGVGFYGELGLDYRVFSIKSSVTDVLGATNDYTATLSGGEIVLGAGLHMLLARTFRVIPKVQLGYGSFTHVSCTASSGCAVNESSFNSATHAFVFLGVGGYFNIDLR